LACCSYQCSNLLSRKLQEMLKGNHRLLERRGKDRKAILLTPRDRFDIYRVIGAADLFFFFYRGK
jgi:hypothetical protein